MAWSGIFAGLSPNPLRQKTLKKLEPARKTIAIHFTPRSGSSWLTQLLGVTEELGTAKEIFNPNFAPILAAKLGVSDLATYVEMARRKYNYGSVFSFEVTGHHMSVVFENHDKFHSHFSHAQNVWLIRKDIIAQAVSLAKMVEVGVSHSDKFDTVRIAKADDAFDYSESAIRQWAMHIYKSEQITESYFKEFSVKPLRISYEAMMKAGPEKTVELFARLTGRPSISLPPDKGLPDRVSSVTNTEYTERFRKQNRIFVWRLARLRRERLRLADTDW